MKRSAARTKDNATSAPLSPTSPDDLDGYLVTSEVERLTTYSRRWLNALIRDSKFPQPDIPGVRGAPNRWRRSTIRKALDDMAAGK